MRYVAILFDRRVVEISAIIYNELTTGMTVDTDIANNSWNYSHAAKKPYFCEENTSLDVGDILNLAVRNKSVFVYQDDRAGPVYLQVTC